MSNLFTLWYMPYWVSFGAIVVFITLFVDGTTRRVQRIKQIVAFPVLMLLCFLMFWTTWTAQDLEIAGDLQTITNQQHISTPDRWWRMH